ncbi:MAG: hypothetical protein ACW97Z_17420 [Candidatus Hodarchaeales archaeon]|jgi:hypothetical protein
MNQKNMLSGILLIGVLAWGFAALSVTGNLGIIPIFDNGNDAGHHGMHGTDHHSDSGHHGMMDRITHDIEECDEYEDHLEEGYDCDNHEYEEYCNQTSKGC